MARRASSFRGRGVSDAQRRKKSWLNITGPAVFNASDNGEQTPNMSLAIDSVTPVTSSLGRSVGLFSDSTLDRLPAESTLLRLRGSVNLPKNSNAADNVENHAIGIGILEAGAAALGAFPNPATPEGGAWDGWMWFRSQQAGIARCERFGRRC